MTNRVTARLPKDHCVHPTVVFKVDLDYSPHRQLITGIRGWLKTKEGLILTRLTVEYNEEVGMTLSASNTAHDSNRIGTSIRSVDMVCELDEKSLKVIDDARLATQKKAVDLKLELVLDVFNSDLLVTNFRFIEPRGAENSVHTALRTLTGNPSAHIVSYWHQNNFQSAFSDGWVLSGNNGPTIMSFNNVRIELDCHISADDWIHDFLPKFGLGKRVVFEIPYDDPVQPVLRHLQNAEEAFGRWDVKSVFAS